MDIKEYTGKNRLKLCHNNISIQNLPVFSIIHHLPRLFLKPREKSGMPSEVLWSK